MAFRFARACIRLQSACLSVYPSVCLSARCPRCRERSIRVMAADRLRNESDSRRLQRQQQQQPGSQRPLTPLETEASFIRPRTLFLLIAVSARKVREGRASFISRLPASARLRDCSLSSSFLFPFFLRLKLSLFLCKMQLYEFRRNFVYFYSTFPFCVKTHGKDFADICFVRRKFVGNILRRFSKHYNSILFESHTVVNLQSTTIRA